jgi:4,5-DOPA dioxygenase extradiol
MNTTREIFNPTRPAGAYDDLVARVLPQAHSQRSWQPSDGPMPALFVSHGAPPTLDDPEWLDGLFTWSQTMPKPKAIVVVSAHWENAPLSISGPSAGTPLFYDFGGFHPRYYTLQYATPDASALAQRALGQRLRGLREEGVLVIGSGFMTHSFAVMRQPSLAGYTAAFDEWAADAIARGDIDALCDYEAKGPGARVAHPTADHFVPLLLTLGASTDPAGRITTAIEATRFGNSIRSIQVS